MIIKIIKNSIFQITLAFNFIKNKNFSKIKKELKSSISKTLKK